MTEQQTNGKEERGSKKERKKGGEGLWEGGRVGDDKESEIKPLGCRRVAERSDQSR